MRDNVSLLAQASVVKLCYLFVKICWIKSIAPYVSENNLRYQLIIYYILNTIFFYWPLGQCIFWVLLLKRKDQISQGPLFILKWNRLLIILLQNTRKEIHLIDCEKFHLQNKDINRSSLCSVNEISHKLVLALTQSHVNFTGRILSISLSFYQWCCFSWIPLKTWK